MSFKNLFPKNNFTKLHVLVGVLTVLAIGF